ncbi:MAG: sporulation protein YqfC [Caldanaerobacter sp.]|uniref:sporulation protein YqfC n=1 Tax=Caldanaerobacter sp. TaxID=2930036 RepID=UPI003C72DAC2
MKRSLKENIIEAIDFPKDALLNFPKITIIGKSHLTVENHRGIVEYLPERVRINSTVGIIRIVGENMVINSIMTEVITITGEIKSVEIVV